MKENLFSLLGGEEQQGRQPLHSHLMVLPVQKQAASNCFADLARLVESEHRPLQTWQEAAWDLLVSQFGKQGAPRPGRGCWGVWDRKLALPGCRAGLAASTPQTPALHSCSPAQGQGAKQLLELLSFTALLFTSRGTDRG